MKQKYYFIGLVYFQHKDLKEPPWIKTYPMSKFECEPEDYDKKVSYEKLELSHRLYTYYSEVFRIQHIDKEYVLENTKLFKYEVVPYNEKEDGVEYKFIGKMWDRLYKITDKFCEEIYNKYKKKPKEKTKEEEEINFSWRWGKPRGR